MIDPRRCPHCADRPPGTFCLSCNGTREVCNLCGRPAQGTGRFRDKECECPANLCRTCHRPIGAFDNACDC